MKEQKKLFEFRAGDIVRDYRFNEEITLRDSRCDDDDDYPLQSTLDNVNCTYTINGKLLSSHDNPIITLVKRPNEKKSVTWYRVSFHYKTEKSTAQSHNTLYRSIQEFLDASLGMKESDFHWIELEPVRTHEYEVADE